MRVSGTSFGHSTISCLRGDSEADRLANHAWDTEAGTLHNDAWPLQLGFHSFDPVMAVTDDTDKIW